jgi:NAD-dependent dihydropyrimidine dehydrogenase PreA subunit
MKRAKLKQVADEIGIELADFDKGKNVSHKHALLVKSFVIANGVLDSDGIVSLAKLKTHGLTRFTGAIKNQFGCIPGLRKVQYHVKLADPHDFATMLVDLNTIIKPRLYIMDGIMAMEGNGPRSGNPRKLSVLLFSSDPIALDATACRIINLDPEIVPTSVPGERAGLGSYHPENIEIVGESIVSFLDKDFKANRTPLDHRTIGLLRAFIKNRVCDRPAINKSKCTNCGTCVQMCPVDPKAVDWHTSDQSKPPTYKYGLCIRCYCCQEMCPDGAVYIRNTVMARILSRF